jgi:hypothetical protein
LKTKTTTAIGAAAGVAFLAPAVLASPALAWDMNLTVTTGCQGTAINVNSAASNPTSADFTVRTLIDRNEANVTRLDYTPSTNTFNLPSYVPLDGQTHRLYVQVIDHDGDLAADTEPQMLNCTPVPPAPPAPPVTPPPVTPPPVTPPTPPHHHHHRHHHHPRPCVPNHVRIHGPHVTPKLGSTVNTWTVTGAHRGGTWVLDHQVRGHGRRLVLRSNQIGHVENGVVNVHTLLGKHRLVWVGHDKLCGAHARISFHVKNLDPPVT